MSLAGFLRTRWNAVAANAAHRRALANVKPEDLETALADWSRSLKDPTGFYLDCHRYFHLRLPDQLRAHRSYFRQQRRGFGEDAFHTEWYLLFRTLKPASFLEIGVYRGQSLSLALMLQDLFACAGVAAGVSPFSPATDSVSRYRADVDYEADTRANCQQFSTRAPTLLRAYSTDPAAVDFIRSRSWDCIYIDGNHDYEVALADWNLCAASVRPGGVIVLDDSGLSTGFAPPVFATKGHPGPSQVAAEVDSKSFVEILQVGHNRAFQKR